MHFCFFAEARVQHTKATSFTIMSAIKGMCNAPSLLTNPSLFAMLQKECNDNRNIPF